MRSDALKWLLCVLVTTACGTRDSSGLDDVAQDTQTYWPTQDWRVSTPARQHMDGARLTDAVRRAREQGEIDALIVIRNGYIVLEEYFNGWNAERAHTLQSVSKSVTSLLIGAAVGQNRMNVNQPVLGFFPEYTDLQNVDERKRALRVQDLLTMRTGWTGRKRTTRAHHCVNLMNRVTTGCVSCSTGRWPFHQARASSTTAAVSSCCPGFCVR